jgi:N-acetylneuraminic acid mutarotase
MQDLPSPRMYTAAASYDGKVFLFGGSEVPPDSSESSVFVYDTASLNWTLYGHMPKRLCGMSATRVEDKIYITGGAQTVFGIPTGEVFAFDPVMNTWEQKASMITPRSFSATAQIGGKIYTIGGLAEGPINNVIPSKAVEVYDPVTDTWTAVSPLSQAILNATAGSAAGSLYVTGGTTGYPYAGITNTFRYDTSTNQWTPASFLPTGRWGAAGVVIDDKFYVIGGNTNLTTNFAKVEVFNPVTGLWTSETPMPTARRSLAASGLGGKIYAMGGLDDIDVLSLVEVFTPALSGIEEEEAVEPDLLQIYANPAGQETRVHYQVTDPGDIEVSLFNVSGALIKRLVKSSHSAGEYTVWVDIAGMANGVYWCVLQTGARRLVVRKMVIMR